MKYKIPRRAFLKRGALSAVAALVLPARAAGGAARKVVVLGAGLAGLAAGYELTRAGHEVTLLEAQERPGGRVLTLRTFDEGLYADAGAARIPGNHEATLRYVKEFGLRLSEQKRRVRDEMTYALATRAFMQTRERFWESERANGFAVADLPAEFWPATSGQPGRRGVLQVYVRHHTATEWAKKNEAERLAAALTLTEQAVPGARVAFKRGAVKCWGEDQWAGCAWTLPSGPQLVAINAPEGCVHFAGEHASVYASWMNGALESGRRAARAVNEAAGREAKT